jgi:hypothetical protein
VLTISGCTSQGEATFSEEATRPIHRPVTGTLMVFSRMVADQPRGAPAATLREGMRRGGRLFVFGGEGEGKRWLVSSVIQEDPVPDPAVRGSWRVRTLNNEYRVTPLL